MDPTQAQLNARLNPQAVTFYLPSTEGLFRAVGDVGGSLYRRVGNKIEYIDLTQLLTPEEKRNAGNYGAQVQIAIQRLKDQYGFDPSTVPAVNMGDLSSVADSQGLQVYRYAGPEGGPNNYVHPTSSDLNSFLGAKQGTALSTKVVNDTPNKLATPEEIAAQMKDPNWNSGTTSNTTQTKNNILAPQVSLQPGQTGDEVKKLQDYLVANGYMTQAEVDTGYGTYGPKTKAAVAKMQSSIGVNAGADAGFYGPKTISAIGSGATATPQSDGYYNINGAFFQKNGDSWQAISDPNILKGLISGSTASTKTDFATTFGSAIAQNVTSEEEAFFNSDEFKALSPDQQSAIQSIFNTVQTNDAQKKELLTKAIEEATKNADPIFKQTLRLSIDALDRGFQDNADDLDYKEKQLTKTLARLKEDSAYSKNDLTIENQKELQALEDELALQLGETRQSLAASGFTDSSRRAKSEAILQKTKGNLVESSNRKFAAEVRNLNNSVTRGEEDTAAEIERLRKLTSSNNLDLGRKVEGIVGSNNLPARSGYTPLGGLIGTAERDRQADIDKAVLDYYNLGFAL